MEISFKNSLIETYSIYDAAIKIFERGASVMIARCTDPVPRGGDRARSRSWGHCWYRTRAALCHRRCDRVACCWASWWRPFSADRASLHRLSEASLRGSDHDHDGWTETSSRGFSIWPTCGTGRAACRCNDFRFGTTSVARGNRRGE